MNIYLLIDGHSVETEVPSKNIVCDDCMGEGKINRFRDDAFTLSDFDGDSEDMSTFCDENASGLYDVKCPTCNGRRVVKGPDLSELSPEGLAQYHAQLERDEDDAAMHRSEARYGA